MLLRVWFAALLVAPQSLSLQESRPMSYPESKKVDRVDDYFGTKIADPYRWLEDLDGAETAGWVEAQNRVTFAYLESIPERGRIKERLTALWDYERYGLPSKEGGRYVFSKNDGLQNQAVLYSAATLDRRAVDPPRSQPPVIRWHRRAHRYGLFRRWALDGLCDVSQRFGLEGMARPRSGNRLGPARPRQVVEVFRCRVAEGWLRIFLWPLPGAHTRPGTGRRQQRPEGLFPSPRHGAGPRRARFRAAGSPRMDLRCRRDRGRALPAHLAERRHRAEEPGVHP